MKKDFGGLGVPNLRGLDICLLGSWIRRYVVEKEKFGNCLLTLSIILRSPTFSHVNLRRLLTFGMVFYGLLMLLGWGIGGK
jgi:hypothetical protein